MIKRFLNRLSRFRWEKFYLNRKIIDTSPYEIKTYVSFLRKIKKKYINCFSVFNSKDTFWNRPRIFIRYDIDTYNCLQNASSVIKVSNELGLPSTAFVRTDEIDYSLEDLSARVSELKKLNIPIGLHSSCYIKAKLWRDALLEEIKKFELIFGVAPSLITVHGLGDFEKSYREEFSTTIATDLVFEGHKLFLDYPPAREYSFVFQDCWQDSLKNRVLFTEFINPPSLRDGENYLVLIHPCYWN